MELHGKVGRYHLFLIISDIIMHTLRNGRINWQTLSKLVKHPEREIQKILVDLIRENYLILVTKQDNMTLADVLIHEENNIIAQSTTPKTTQELKKLRAEIALKKSTYDDDTAETGMASLLVDLLITY